MIRDSVHAVHRSLLGTRYWLLATGYCSYPQEKQLAVSSKSEVEDSRIRGGEWEDALILYTQTLKPFDP